jgi:creatinine amidohydrolase
MKAVLKDTIDCLYNWGFNNIYVLNLHGDYLHSKTLLEIVKEIHEINSNRKKVYNILHESFKGMLGVCGSEPYILVENNKVKENDKENRTENIYLDVHAGSFETSLMLLEYDELVDEELARKLESSRTTLELLRKWQNGGSEAIEVTPLGYCGEPANIDLKSVGSFIDNFSKSAAKLITDSI